MYYYADHTSRYEILRWNEMDRCWCVTQLSGKSRPIEAAQEITDPKNGEVFFVRYCLSGGGGLSQYRAVVPEPETEIVRIPKQLVSPATIVAEDDIPF